MEETMIDSASTETQEVQATEPAAVDNNENQTVDYWDEDTKLEDVEAETSESEPEKVDTEDAAPVEPEYVTEGLGELEKPIVIKYKGKLFDIKDKDQVRDLMERGMGATQKLQELADIRRQLLKEQNPEMTDTELSEVDATNEVETIAQKISTSSYVDEFKDVVSYLPDDITTQLRSNPQMLEGLRADVESGFAKKIMQYADRYMNIDGMSFKDAYIKGGQEVMKATQTKSDSVDRLTSVPKRTGNVEVKQKDIWDLSDAEYKQLMSSERR